MKYVLYMRYSLLSLSRYCFEMSYLHVVGRVSFYRHAAVITCVLMIRQYVLLKAYIIVYRNYFLYCLSGGLM